MEMTAITPTKEPLEDLVSNSSHNPIIAMIRRSLTLRLSVCLAALLVLAEYTIMSAVLYWSFSHPIEVNTCTTYAPLQSSIPLDISYCSYLGSVCNFLDVFKNLAPKKSYSGNDFDSTERLLISQKHDGDYRNQF